MPWTTEQVTAALAAVGGVCGGVGAAVGKWRESHRQEKKDADKTALAAEDLKLREIKELYRIIEGLRTNQERMALKQEQTETKLDAAEEKLEAAYQAIRECEHRDALKAREIEELKDRDASKARDLELSDARYKEITAHIHNVQKDLNKLHEDHYGVAKTSAEVELKTEKVEAKTERLAEKVETLTQGLPDPRTGEGLL